MAEPSKKMTRRGMAPAITLAALVCAGAASLVLYGIGGVGGKEASCPAAAARAGRLAPLARGEVAAMRIAKAPKPAPDVSFKGPDGKALRLADFRGRTVLLNLWATWCAPCRKEMPALDRLQAAAGGADFEVVAVNIDTRNLDKPKAFLEEIGVNRLAQYADPTADIFQKLRQSSGVLGLPATILVDRDGCEAGVMLGPAEWDSPDGVALVRAAAGE